MNKAVLRFWAFALIYAGILLALWQIPASFYLQVPEVGSQSDQSYLRDFYPAENSGDTRFRWGSTGTVILLPPLSSKTQITLRLSVIPRPDQPPGQLVIQLDGKETARFDLRPGWEEYSFVLDKKLAGPGFLELELVTPAFQVKGDARLFTVGFNWAREETLAGLQVPPLGSFLALWLTGIIFYFAAFIQAPRLKHNFNFVVYAGGVLLAAWIPFSRVALAWGWLVMLLVAVGLLGLSLVLRPEVKGES